MAKSLKLTRKQRAGRKLICQPVGGTRRFVAVLPEGPAAEPIGPFDRTKKTPGPPPREAADPGGRLSGSSIEIIGKTPEKVRARFGRNPARRATWGQTGRYVRVESKKPFGSATLRFRLEGKEAAHLHPSSIFVARWEKGAGRFFLIPQSGYNAGGRYAYARITRGGTYTAIGLPRDPRLLTTLRLFSVLSPWTRILGNRSRAFVRPICKAMLCPDVMGPDGSNADRLRAAGLDPESFPGGFGGGNPCKQCLDLDPAQLPEIDILRLVGAEARADRPFDPWIPGIAGHRDPPPTWTSIGPANVTGRTTVLAAHPTDPQVLYAGAAGGGVWKTVDGGATWFPTMYDEESLAIGGLAISASNPEVLYAGTGEWTGGLGSGVDPVAPGAGVFRTRNAGARWEPCAPIPSRTCAAVAVDPTDSQRVFVAASTGLHVSRDGGASWSYVDFSGQPVTDVAIAPDDPHRIYVGVHRQGVFRFNPSDNSSQQLSSGIATGADARVPRIALGRAGEHGSLFVVVKMGNEIYTSVDGGSSFRQRTGVFNPSVPLSLLWASAIAVDPRDENTLYAGDVDNLHLSVDGGQSWNEITAPGHPSVQSLAFDPGDSDHFYVATDSAILAMTLDRAALRVTWETLSLGMATGQFFSLRVSPGPSTRVGGATTVDGVVYAGAPDWQAQGTGPAGYLEFDPANADVVYGDAWFVNLLKIPGADQNWTDLGIDTVDETTGNYAQALTISSRDPQLLLAIRKDGKIVRARFGGVPGPGRQPAWEEVHGPFAFSAIQFAPSDDTYAYAGTRDGLVFRSVDHGRLASWQPVDTAALDGRIIRRIVVDPRDPRRFFVACFDPRHHDQARHLSNLFRGEIDDLGQVAWTDISRIDPDHALPDLPLTGLALDPMFEGVIYVSTPSGVLRSTDGGGSWAPFGAGLPNAFVSDLALRDSERALYASTMGRGVYRIPV